MTLDLELRGVSKHIRGGRRRAGRRRHRSRRGQRRIHRAARALRLRQDHDVAHGGGLRGARPRAASSCAARHHRRAAAPTRHGHGVPELCAVPAHDGAREHRVRSAQPQGGRTPRPRSAWRRHSGSSVWAPSRNATRASCRAASSNEWRWPGCWRSIPSCCCSTSRCPISTPSCAAQMRHEIRKLQKEVGVTTLFVTHDQDEAMTMADRVVVLNQGRIEQIGTPVEIYEHPQTRFVADFIGTSNFFARPRLPAAKRSARCSPAPAACASSWARRRA